MKIVKFKDGTYGIRKFDLWGNFYYKFVNFNLIKRHVEFDKENGKILLVDSSLQTKAQIEAFECCLWVGTKKEEQNQLTVNTSCKCENIFLANYYFMFIRNKEYKSKLGKFDYGEEV